MYLSFSAPPRMDMRVEAGKVRVEKLPFVGSGLLERVHQLVNKHLVRCDTAELYPFFASRFLYYTSIVDLLTDRATKLHTGGSQWRHLVPLPHP